MANEFRDRVWRIDTAAATNISTDRPLTFASIVWDDATGSAGDNAVIADKDGNVVLSLVADAANQTVTIPGPITIPGLRVPTLDAGVLYFNHDIYGP